MQLDSALAAPLAIASGAVPGALSRYYLNGLVAQRLSARFPWGTLIINLSGSLLIGFVTVLATSRMMSPNLHLLLTTGFLGAYTTFSTYALDIANLWRSHSRPLAVGYWAASAVGGGLCLVAGIKLARWLL